MIQGKRSLPLKYSRIVADKLNLGPKERTCFLESLYGEKTSLDKIVVSDTDQRFMVDESYFAFMAEWEHDAVLTLMDCSDFILSEDEICRRLGINSIRAGVVIHNLLQCGLLVNDESGWKKAHSSVRTTEDVASTALRIGHKETLEMGKHKLDEVDVLLRDFSSMMVAMDPEKMTEVKTIIREFRQKMAALLRDGNKTEVYQLAIQLYPMTITEERSLS